MVCVLMGRVFLHDAPLDECFNIYTSLARYINIYPMMVLKESTRIMLSYNSVPKLCLIWNFFENIEAFCMGNKAQIRSGDADSREKDLKPFTFRRM